MIKAEVLDLVSKLLGLIHSWEQRIDCHITNGQWNTPDYIDADIPIDDIKRLVEQIMEEHRYIIGPTE